MDLLFVNILLNIPITVEFEAYLVKNHKQIIVSSPSSLANRIKKLVPGFLFPIIGKGSFDDLFLKHHTGDRYRLGNRHPFLFCLR